MRFAKKQNPVKIVVEIKTLPRYVRSQLITYISMIGCEKPWFDVSTRLREGLTTGEK